MVLIVVACLALISTSRAGEVQWDLPCWSVVRHAHSVSKESTRGPGDSARQECREMDRLARKDIASMATFRKG